MLNFANGTVLIVDDNETVRQIVHSVVERLGFMKIVEAENGADAWMQVEKSVRMGTSLQLIVCDIDMPTMNGIEFLSRVRDHRVTRNLPFILLTAHAEEELVKQAIASGVTNYLTKPFCMNSVEKKIRETMEREVTRLKGAE
jgi:CheY-like chemotaxis protein